MLLSLLLLISTATWAIAESESVLVPYQSFISRPDILAPVLNVRLHDTQSISPGYIFLSTWSSDRSSETQNAPYIFDNDGELIYTGYSHSLPTTKYFNFQSHHFSNHTPVLSVFRGTSNRGRGKGHIGLYDDTYRVIRTINAPDGRDLDFHEFRLLDDGHTAIVVALRPIEADLSRFGIRQGLGWLLDSVFWVLDLADDKTQVMFEWRASEQIGMEESMLEPSVRGRMAGMSWKYAYDYFHINSIDRFANGDFLVSARHTDTIYRISGKDRSVLWRLGGKKSSFTLLNFTFSAQHDVKIVQESDDGRRVVVSLLDNAYNGITKTSNSSSAIVIEVDAERKQARLLKRFFPASKTLAQNQGSVQHLPDEHTLVSWGLVAEFSEFDQDGTRVLDVAFAESMTRAYRVQKFDWVGRPDESEIAVYLYARTNDSNVYFWMSWNGATEVREWRVLREDGLVLGVVEWEGFETFFDAGRFVSSGYVEAVGNDGKTLGRSKVVQTLVPTENMAEVCGDAHCMMQILPSKTAAFDSPAKGQKRPLVSSSSVAWDMSWLSMASGVVVGLLVSRMRWPTAVCIRAFTALLRKVRAG
ncbi:hypothetical protein AC579_2339 [Pseudocercospora musae]|uniref:Arylsulfotransferase N-terminal domain-containing protein n=1 Tax=Pseudocercospora musae TaxID=113226 RepID=A0A139IGX7_9PEZI|nr:hypothetical protein AC579_2339 [Pseudocercospora musae]